MGRSEHFNDGAEPPERYWHVTSRKDFKPSTSKRPVAGGGRRAASEPSLYVTKSPHYWNAIAGAGPGKPHAASRKWAAEIEPLPTHPPIPRGGHQESILDPAHVKVTRVIPVEHAIGETTGWLDHPEKGPTYVGSYRYSGPDFPERKPRKKK